MNAIKMKRLDLLDIVRANKEKHIADFNEAVTDYVALVLTNADFNLKLARTAELKEFRKMKLPVQPPTSYEDSYKRAIRMLELSVDNIIEVEEDVFNQLVLDEWSWKHSFVTSSSMYKGG